MNINKLTEKCWAAIYPDRKPWDTLAQDVQKEWVRFVSTTIEVYEKETGLGDKLKWLSALETAGVDNWEGVEYAQSIYHDERD